MSWNEAYFEGPFLQLSFLLWLQKPAQITIQKRSFLELRAGSDREQQPSTRFQHSQEGAFRAGICRGYFDASNRLWTKETSGQAVCRCTSRIFLRRTCRWKTTLTSDADDHLKFHRQFTIFWLFSLQTWLQFGWKVWILVSDQETGSEAYFSQQPTFLLPLIANSPEQKDFSRERLLIQTRFGAPESPSHLPYNLRSQYTVFLLQLNFTVEQSRQL